MRLNEIAPKPGSTKARTRVGRGVGSGKGKTGGRGVKGQKSRSGVALKGFEGGQMPIYMRIPKRGFNPLNPKRYAVINLATLETAIASGKLDTKATIDEGVLKSAGVVKHLRDGVRLLAKGELKSKLTLELTGASKAAVVAVEKAGGSVKLTGDSAESADA